MKVSRRQIVSWSLLALFLIMVWVIQSSPLLGEWYARKIYPPVAYVLSSFSSLLPFSVGDIYIVLTTTCILVMIFRLFTRKEKRGKHFIRLITFCGWIYVWFYLAWGLNYFRQDFYTRTQIPRAQYTADTFKDFLKDYVKELNESYTATDTINTVVVAQEAKSGYRELTDLFGTTPPAGGLKVKNMLSSRLMSKMGISGYMGPFFTEFNLNKALLPSQYPATYTHEMAHRLSIANEAEANLYAWIVCTSSTDSLMRFSGHLSLLGYIAQNASSLLSETEYKEFTDSIRPEIRTLYARNHEHWRSMYSPVIGKIQNYFYNLFLKSNRIASGTKNYSEVVGLLISYQEYEKAIAANTSSNRDTNDG